MQRVGSSGWTRSNERGSALIRAARGVALVLATAGLGLATSSTQHVPVAATTVAVERADPMAAMAASLQVLDTHLAGAERTLDRIDREAWTLRSITGATWVRMGQAQKTLQQQVEATMPSPDREQAPTEPVGPRLDRAFDRLRGALASAGVRVAGTRARLATAQGGLERLQSQVDEQVREVLAVLADIRAQAFEQGLDSPPAELLATGRQVLVRLMVLKREVAVLRTELFGLSDGLGRQRRDADERLASALAREAAAFGLPFGRLPEGADGWGIFQVCPVDQPRTVYNDFGAVRTGGGYHAHQGNDIAAPLGTPVRAPFPGEAVASPNVPGGLAVKVFGAHGFVYNAHLSRYGMLGRVEAGTVIGYVGNSGNANGGTPHNHFEWHPGGGGAVDPHPFLMQVC